jgi:hypothetical protein
VTETSRFPRRRRTYMPGSQTTRGGTGPRNDGPRPVAFCCHDGIGTPNDIAFAAPLPGLYAPLSTLRLRPRSRLRMTRGRCGSLPLHRNGLAPSTSCRSPGAPRLNGWPIRSLTDASPTPSRTPAHGSGATWIATPSSQWTFTTYSLPVSRRTHSRLRPAHSRGHHCDR